MPFIGQDTLVALDLGNSLDGCNQCLVRLLRPNLGNVSLDDVLKFVYFILDPWSVR